MAIGRTKNLTNPTSANISPSILTTRRGAIITESRIIASRTSRRTVGRSTLPTTGTVQTARPVQTKTLRGETVDNSYVIRNSIINTTVFGATVLSNFNDDNTYDTPRGSITVGSNYVFGDRVQGTTVYRPQTLGTVATGSQGQIITEGDMNDINLHLTLGFIGGTCCNERNTGTICVVPESGGSFSYPTGCTNHTGPGCWACDGFWYNGSLFKCVDGCTCTLTYTSVTVRCIEINFPIPTLRNYFWGYQWSYGGWVNGRHIDVMLLPYFGP